ncbi:MAG: hypothetical protein OXE41_03040 [Gammaproteobacteria bacterium]|nr:hypothetical protein [Gammaproteobacteria bacterium]
MIAANNTITSLYLVPIGLYRKSAGICAVAWLKFLAIAVDLRVTNAFWAG